MSVTAIVCINCGAKYKLPPTFKGTRAKCPKCSSIIDVAKQLAKQGADDGAKPAAAAKPAAKARPAKDRSRAGAGARKALAAKSAATKPARPARGRARGKDDDGDKPRRARGQQKKNNTPLILSGVGLVLLLGLGGFFLMGGEEEQPQERASTDTTANASAPTGENEAPPTPAPASDAADAAPADAKLDALVGMVKAQLAKAGMPADAVSEDEVKKMLQEQLEAQSADLAQLPDAAMATIAQGLSAAFGSAGAGAGAGSPAEAAPNPDAVPMPDGPKEPWMKQKRPAQTMADVRSAAELYGEVRWSESIDDATKAEVQSIAEDLDVNGGIRHIRAKRKIVDAGYAGLFAIVERLHGLDYRDADDAAFGFELNKMIEEITGGLNARYAAVQAGEDVHPAKAQWNTKTVKAWMSTFAKWPDEAAFKKAKKELAKKNADK